jgi:predicted PurR-regulated permease PerM
VSYGTIEAATHMGELRRELSGDRVLDLTVAQDRTLIEGIAHVASGTPGRGQVRVQSSTTGDIYFVDEDGDGVRQIGLIERITTAVTTGVRRIPVSRERAEQLARSFETQAGQALELGVEASRGLKTFLGTVKNFLGYVLLVPVYTFFLLLSLSDLRERARALLPGRYRARILDVLTKIDRAVAAFFRGRVLIGIGKGFLIWLGLAIVGVRFSFFIGMGAGLLSIIPFVGPLVGGALSLVLAYEGTGSYLGRAVGVLVTFSAAEALEAAAFPVVIGRETGLHPLALILALFAFGNLFGLFGVLLAIPIACVVKILFVEFVLPELRELAQEEPGAPAP